MPALPAPSVLDTLVARDAALATNTSNDALSVICAWPVSGQYGPGSRILYYVLVIACVVARKTEWLKKACIAAALIFPAIAAIHAIVLAALHNDQAVDMDIYGAFQLCSIGILAAPVTVRISKTYFNDPGRNTIFLWTGLILSGLLSLTVEFFRIQTTPCTHDDHVDPIPRDIGEFLKQGPPLCGLPCTFPNGPQSPLRGGANDEVYVIPAPSLLTFGTTTLLSAACCIPAILSMVSMWNKIAEINWIRRWKKHQEPGLDDLIDGTNGATYGKMNRVNDMIRGFLSVVEVPLFGGAVLAIIIAGEINFFSAQVNFQTEPMLSVGQWGPMVGTAFAALGSLYVLLAADIQKVKEVKENPEAPTQHCNCSHHHHGDELDRPLRSRPSAESSDSRRLPVIYDSDESPPSDPPEMGEVGLGLTESPGAVWTSETPPAGIERIVSNDLATSTTQSTAEGPSRRPKRSWTADANRRKVAEKFASIGNFFGTPAFDWNDDSEFGTGKAQDYPEIPGERGRNPELHLIKSVYDPRRDADGNVTPGLQDRSRAGSIRSMRSDVEDEGSPTPRTPSPSNSPTTRSRPRTNTLPVMRTTSDPDHRGRLPQRRDTLTVPSRNNFHRHTRSNSSTASMPSGSLSGGLSSPVIVVSSEPDGLELQQSPEAGSANPLEVTEEPAASTSGIRSSSQDAASNTRPAET